MQKGTSCTVNEGRGQIRGLYFEEMKTEHIERGRLKEDVGRKRFYSFSISGHGKNILNSALSSDGIKDLTGLGVFL